MNKMQMQGDRANLTAAIVYTGVTVLLWDLFRPVNEWLSTGIAIFSLIANWLPESLYKAAHTKITLYFGMYCRLIGCDREFAFCRNELPGPDRTRPVRSIYRRDCKQRAEEKLHHKDLHSLMESPDGTAFGARG